MDHIRGLLQFILDRHEPYGAVVTDRYWNVIMSNHAAVRSLGSFSDPSRWARLPVNLLRLVFYPSGIRRVIVNWQQVARHVMAPQDVTLQELCIETFLPADEASERVLRAMATAADRGDRVPGRDQEVR